REHFFFSSVLRRADEAMSCSLSARCIRRTIVGQPQSSVQSVSSQVPAARHYSVAALKTRPAPPHTRRTEPVLSYARPAALEPDVRWMEKSDVRPRDDQVGVATYKPAAAELRRRPREVGSSTTRDRVLHIAEGSGAAARRTGSTITATRSRSETRQVSGGSSTPGRASKPDALFSEHLNGLFEPLKFPPELSARILTHASHPAAFHGHNGQFSFMGRRVLESYLLILLASSPKLKPSHDLQDIVSRVLNTYFLGQHIGSQWGLGRVMRWTPTVAASMLEEGSPLNKEKILKDVGLYKVQGDAVTAVVGGIFQQFGASVAHRVFHTRMLPLLLEPVGGLPATFHSDALRACSRLGGAEGKLVHETSPASQTKASVVIEAGDRQTLQL
ncbi:unnamed protein product, partial [Mycena citricolor]